MGGLKLAPAIRLAKVVPVSMADKSAEPLLEGSVMSRERRPNMGVALIEVTNCLHGASLRMESRVWWTRGSDCGGA